MSSSEDKYRSASCIRQQQKRLPENEIEELIAEYEAGSTVYELAAQFGCHRTTVSGCLKARGVRMRLTPLTDEQVSAAVCLYESGLSLVTVGHQVGANAETIRTRLRERGTVIRDAHGRRVSHQEAP